MIDDADKAILRIMQDDIPLVSRPFLVVAERLGIGEEEVISRVKRLIDSRVVRRFSASIRHRKLGITANPLCAWKVPEGRVDDVGKKMSSFEEVTHCYERLVIPGKWEYNVFTMIHGYNRKSVEETTKRISEAVDIKNYELIYSVKEFKKIYRRYV